MSLIKQNLYKQASFIKNKIEMGILPLAAMEKILKKAGASRVSEEAKVAFREILEEISDDIAAKAIKNTSHAGRKTVKGSDIKLASK